MTNFCQIHKYYVKYDLHYLHEFYYLLIYFQILGENVKEQNDDGTLAYEIGVIYYEQCTRDKTKFKRMSEWWLVDVNDVVCQLPAEEKISTNCMLYTFQLP